MTVDDDLRKVWIGGGSPSDSTAELPIVDDPVWTFGDFEVITIITSDRCRFFVPTFHLLSSSSVFRNAAELGAQKQDQTVYFTDPDFETAATFRQFLALVTTGRVKNADKELLGMRELVLFLQKYDAVPAMRIVLLDIREQLQLNTVHPIKAFVVAAACDDIVTSSLAVETTSWVWNAGPETELAGGTPRAYSIDPFHIPYNLYLHIPPTYMWALMRAFGKERTTGRKVVGEFQRLVKLARSGGKEELLPLPPRPTEPVA